MDRLTPKDLGFSSTSAGEGARAQAKEEPPPVDRASDVVAEANEGNGNRNTHSVELQKEASLKFSAQSNFYWNENGGDGRKIDELVGEETANLQGMAVMIKGRRRGSFLSARNEAVFSAGAFDAFAHEIAPLKYWTEGEVSSDERQAMSDE